MSTTDPLVRTLLIVVAVLLLVPFLLMTFMIPLMGLWGWGHAWNGGVWGGAGTTWMSLLMWLVVLSIVGGLGYLLYRAIHRPLEGETDPAIEELRIAYARGELSDEEYEERRERLQREREPRD